jgi:hypothetical protein
MTYLPFWAFWALNILASGVFIYFNYKNAELLTPEQKEEKARLLHDENKLSRPQNWGFLGALVVLVLLNLYSSINIPVRYFFYLIILNSAYTIFRNRSIYKKINLPEKFIQRELLLGICSIAILAIMIFVIF